jgi:hypothetical protein
MRRERVPSRRGRSDPYARLITRPGRSTPIVPDHTVPYGTVPVFAGYQAINCLATIISSPTGPINCPATIVPFLRRDIKASFLRRKNVSRNPYKGFHGEDEPPITRAHPPLISQQTASNVLDTVYIDTGRVWRRGAVCFELMHEAQPASP